MAISSKATIAEVAKAAGVSIATVSRIINKKGNVRPETVQRVIDAMRELDFGENHVAALANPGAKVLLTCMPDFSNPFNGQVIDGIHQAAAKRGYHIILLQIANAYQSAEFFLPTLLSYPADGILLISSVSNPEFLDAISGHCPVVMCSEYCEGYDISYVSIDDIGAARTATEYLISTGHKKIALLNSSRQSKYSRHREEGYRQAMEAAGIEINPEWVTHLSAINFEIAVSSATHTLSMENRPDAFFTVSDVYAAAVIKAAKKLGLHVPEDVAVVGFDNTELSQMTDPPITTIKQSSYEIGFQACNLLMDKVENPDMSNKQIVFGTELIVRGSTRL